VKRISSKKFLPYILLLILSFVLVCFPEIGIVKAEPKTIIVPDDYLKIQWAIGNASEGDTIFVKEGTYYENLMISKPLSLRGENKKAVVIGSGGVEGENIFTIESDHVEITGFSIKGLDYSSPRQYPNGIKIGGDNCSITGNNIENTFWGILCPIQSFTSISSNNIRANLKEGIRFYGGNYNVISSNNISENVASGIALEGYLNTISGNNIENNGRGVGLGSSYSIVYGNWIVENSESGIYFTGANNIISANQIADSTWGIYFAPHFGFPKENKFYHNNFVGNSENVYVTSSYNIQYWDDGYPSGGNYWSDYMEKNPNAEELNDETGIMNTPYVICADNMDMYPLAAPFDSINLDSLPSVSLIPKAKSGEPVALWHFDKVEPNNVTLDAQGYNPAILGSVTGNISYTPTMVEGKFGNALRFDGNAYIFVPASPGLEIQSEITIDAWVKVEQFKEVAYNNIVIQSVRDGIALPIRTVGFAFNGELPTNNGGLLQGALRGYLVTDEGNFNEIFTTDFILPLNEWTHVTFTRSLSTGMHIYVDGKEQKINVASGVQNPVGTIKRSTYMYIGHDSKVVLDEISICNNAQEMITPPFWTRWWFLTILIALIVVFVVSIFFDKKACEKSH